MRLLTCAVLALALGGCGREELTIRSAEGTGRSLDVVYSTAIGPELGDADVEEHEDRVVVTLRDDCFVGCDTDDAEIFHCVRIKLDEPLGSRQLIDGSTGRPPKPRSPSGPMLDIDCQPPP